MDHLELQRDALTWRDGVPVSTLFDDPYFSFQDGLAETRHVFLAGNELPRRFCDGFHVAELGFGTGLNALATLQAWEAAGVAGSFRFTSFEAHPMEASAMARALAGWDGLAVEAFVAQWQAGSRAFALGPMRLDVVVGDVAETLPGWDGLADAWYLDGFSPAKNPEMWSEPVLREVGRHTAPGGTCSSYTAASAVRARLQAGGFEVDRVAGFGRKRHMTVGRL